MFARTCFTTTTAHFTITNVSRYTLVGGATPLALVAERGGGKSVDEADRVVRSRVVEQR